MPALQPATADATGPTIPLTATLAHDAASTAAHGNSPPHEATPVSLKLGDAGIPARILIAYREAADTLATDKPGCHLPWELLAAIGKVESGHAQGRPLTTDGTITRPILGPPLNGSAGVALIRDTDHGTLDHDTVYDRAVGPMQFIPTTWASAGRDGNGDGRRDPHNIHDATLAAAHYLCGHGRDLTNPGDLRSAIYAYNPSETYIRTVLAWMRGYQNTATPATVSPPPATNPATPRATEHSPAPGAPNQPHTTEEPVPGTQPVPTVAPHLHSGLTTTPTQPTVSSERDIIIVPLTPRPTATVPPASLTPTRPVTTPAAPTAPPTTSPTAAGSADSASVSLSSVSPMRTSVVERPPTE